jgi:hypothetical protein
MTAQRCLIHLSWNQRNLNSKSRSNKKLPQLFDCFEEKWSGRMDLNHRPPGPEPGALARLRYAPTVCAQAAQNSRANQARIAQLPQSRPFPAILGSGSVSDKGCQLNRSMQHHQYIDSTMLPRGEAIRLPVRGQNLAKVVFRLI